MTVNVNLAVAQTTLPDSQMLDIIKANSIAALALHISKAG